MTQQFSRHLCNPTAGTCKYYASDMPLPVATPAVSRLQVDWSYTRLDGYSNETFFGWVFNGRSQEIIGTRQDHIDYFPVTPLLPGSSAGTSMAGTIRRGGGAEADVTVTVTYPQ